jgi:hypothetical protein
MTFADPIGLNIMAPEGNRTDPVLYPSTAKYTYPEPGAMPPLPDIIAQSLSEDDQVIYLFPINELIGGFSVYHDLPSLE